MAKRTHITNSSRINGYLFNLFPNPTPRAFIVAPYSVAGLIKKRNDFELLLAFLTLLQNLTLTIANRARVVTATETACIISKCSISKLVNFAVNDG